MIGGSSGTVAAVTIKPWLMMHKFSHNRDFHSELAKLVLEDRDDSHAAIHGWSMSSSRVKEFTAWLPWWGCNSSRRLVTLLAPNTWCTLANSQIYQQISYPSMTLISNLERCPSIAVLNRIVKAFRSPSPMRFMYSEWCFYFCLNKENRNSILVSLKVRLQLSIWHRTVYIYLSKTS